MVVMVAVVAIARDLTVALDLLLRDRFDGYAHLGVASVIAIWTVVLAAVAMMWPNVGRPPIWPPRATRTFGNALVSVGIFIAVDWIFGFPLARVASGSVALHVPASWIAFAAIAVGGPLIEEWLFRGVLWDAIASRTHGRAVTIAPVVITSVLFGIWHCRWMCLPTWLSPSGTPIVLHVAFGACMAVLRWRFRSVGPGVIVHGIWNALYPLTS